MTAPQYFAASDQNLLAEWVVRCGFDAETYLRSNNDLREAGFDRRAAMAHFLAHGYAEEREPRFGVIGDGLSPAPELPDSDYVNRLFRSVFFGQLRNPGTFEAMWHRAGSELLDSVQHHGGIPYFVVGDSHASLYRRCAWSGTRWLAPLPLVCHGASASGLGNETSQSRYGDRILRWADRLVRSRPLNDTPIFLKFGGIDAEFLWIRRRLRDGITAFSLSEYSACTASSVARYSRFLDQLTGLIAPERLRICSVFPAVLADAVWIEGYVAAHRQSATEDRQLAVSLQALEIPDLSGRTALRASYNTALRQMCDEKGLTFIDDFTPLLAADGLLDRYYHGTHGGTDTHVDHAASDQPLTEIVMRYLTTVVPPPTH